MVELLKKIVRVGNSAGVVLPKEWLNGLARIELVEKPLDIKKDTLEILSPYLEDLLGIYLVGSYARGEQDLESDVDIIAISRGIQKEIKEGKYNFSIYSLENIKATLEKNPLMILPRLLEAKPIFNSSLLKELKKPLLGRDSFQEFVESSKRIYAINNELFKIDKTLDENNIYSIILRLRGFYIASCLLKGKAYSKKGFKNFLIREEIKFEEVYDIYRKVKSGEQIKKTLSEPESLKLLNLLEKEVKSYGKKRKETN